MPLLSQLLAGCLFIGPAEVERRLDADGDGVVGSEDCDDQDPLAWQVEDWYLDSDGDGYGADADPVSSCGSPGQGYVALAGDCDDQQAEVHPGAEELCGDGLDNDCDGLPGDCRLEGELSLDDADGRFVGSSDGDGLGWSAVLLAPGAAGQEAGGIVLGAPGVDDGAGAVYFFAPPLDGLHSATNAALTIDGEVQGDAVGYVLAVMSDIDGEGHGVVVVGAPGVGGEEGGYPGEVVLVGSVDADRVPLSEAGAVVPTPSGAGYFGGSLAVAADTNGDGMEDLLVGGPGGSALSLGGDVSGPGRAWLFLGGPGGDLQGEPSGTLVGESDGDLAGLAVAAGDLDSDGLDDLVVGAPGRAENGPDSGAAYVVYSPVDARASLAMADARALGTRSAVKLGGALAVVADFDGDGSDDLALGAPGAGNGTYPPGAVFLYLAEPSGELGQGDAEIRLDGDDEGFLLGTSVASAGDLDGDGLGDLLAGGPGENPGGDASGAQYLVYGGLGQGRWGIGGAAAWLPGSESGDGLGLHVFGTADVDGDGLLDILASAVGQEVGTGTAGTAWLFLGSF